MITNAEADSVIPGLLSADCAVLPTRGAPNFGKRGAVARLMATIETAPTVKNTLHQLKGLLFRQPQPIAGADGTPIPCPPPASEISADPEPEFAPPAEREPVNLGAIARQVRILLLAVLLSTISYYWISRFVVTTVVVQGNSMTPTLHEGDRFLLNRWAYTFGSPQRGDLVVLKDPGHIDYAVKRIVGMPLDAILLKQGNVFINGRLIIEPYLSSETRTYSSNRKENLIMLGKNRYYVLGDSRSNSEDSRFYGPVHRSQILGLIKLPGNNGDAEISKLRFEELPSARARSLTILPARLLAKSPNASK